MKKIISLLLPLVLFFGGCKKKEPVDGDKSKEEITAPEHKSEEAKVDAPTDSLADSIIGKVITLELDGDVNPIQFYEDGRMLMGENGSVKDFGLTYKIENNEVLVFKEEVRDGGISFSSSIPKVGDQVEWGPEEDKKRGEITKIKAADGIEGVPFEELENRETFFYHKDSTLLYQGKAHELYPNGKLKGVYTYKDGIQWGLTTRWHMNGQKEVEVNLKIGKPDGLVVEWHENGQKRLEVNYKDGKEVEGSAKFWNYKGEEIESPEESLTSKPKLEGVSAEEIEREDESEKTEYGNINNEERIKQSKEDIEAFVIALLNYKISSNGYPTTAQGLQALLTKPADARGWNGPYIRGKITDPWGNEYGYRFPSKKGQQRPDIFSKGADGLENTADDIGNWKKASD